MATVPERVREILVEARDAGLPFGPAWRGALARVTVGAHSATEAEEWRRALRATRGSWRAAFAGEPPAAHEAALYTVAVDPDRQPLLPGETGRWCEYCDEPIPHTRHLVARYCSYECQRAANGRHVAAA